MYISNLQTEEIRSPEELHECLRIAQRNRAVAAARLNESKFILTSSLKLQSSRKLQEAQNCSSLSFQLIFKNDIRERSREIYAADFKRRLRRA